MTAPAPTRHGILLRLASRQLALGINPISPDFRDEHSVTDLEVERLAEDLAEGARLLAMLRDAGVDPVQVEKLYGRVLAAARP